MKKIKDDKEKNKNSIIKKIKKKELKKEVKKEPKKEVKKEPKKEVKKEHKKEVKKEPKKELKKEHKKEVKKAIKKNNLIDIINYSRMNSFLNSIMSKKKKSIMEPEIENKFKIYMKLPLSYRFNKNNVKKFLDACDIKTRPIAEIIINKTRHISFEEMIKFLNKNIEDLISKVPDDGIIHICIKESYIDIKSNYWLYLYVRDYIKYKYPEIMIKLLICDDEDSIKDANLKNNDVFVFIDDCIYTGNQMKQNIEAFIKIINKILFIKLININIYILSSFISKQGQELIEKINYGNAKIIFNKYINDLPLTNKVLSISQILLINKYYSHDEIYNDFLNKYLIYFDHKLADFVSTIPLFYSGVVPNKHNKKIFDEDEDIDEDKLQIIPLFTNCEKIRNIDIWEPKCPSTPYKKDMNEAFMKEIDKKKKALSY